MANLQNLRPFPKGRSGNPSGISKAQKIVEKNCRAASEQVVDVLVELLSHDDPNVRIKAGTLLWDRGFGRTRKHTEHSGEVQHQISVGQMHLAAIRDLSESKPKVIEDEEATVIETPVSSESRDAQKIAYAERRRANASAR